MATKQPDIRVRLSAEGQQEVVNAFKKISAEAVRTGKKGSKGIGLLNNSLKSFKTLLPTIAIGALVAGLGAFVKSSIDAADVMNKVAQSVGLTVETISGLAFAAELSDVSLDEFASRLTNLNRRAKEGARGVKSYALAFEKLGISLTDQDGKLKKTDVLLLEIADRFSTMEDGTLKSAIATDIFSNAGVKMIPFLNQGAAGIKKLVEEGRSFGRVISAESAAAAEQFNDNLTRLKAIAQGAGLQIAKQLLPALINFTDNFINSAKSSTFLKDAIVVLAGAFKLLFNVISIVNGVFVVAGDLIRNVAAAAINVARGDFRAAWESIKQGGRDTAATVAKTWDDVKNVWTGTARDIAGQAGRISDQLSEPARQTSSKIRAAARRLQEQLLKGELALLKATLKLQAAEEQIGFDRRITNMEEFFAARRRILKEQAAAEIAILQKRAETERARPLLATEVELDRKKNLSALENEIAVRRLELEAALLVLFGQERSVIKQTEKEVEDFERKLLELQGQRFAIARRELQDQADQLEAVLTRQGIAEEERRRRVGVFTAAGEAKVAFEEIQQAAQEALAQLAADRRAIEDQVLQGLIFQFQGENQILTLEQQRIPVLEEIADALLEAALITKDPELIESAQAFADTIRDLRIESNKAGQAMADFRISIEQALTSDLNDFFLQGITDSKSFGDAMRNMALSVVESLRRIAAQILATILIQKLLGAIGLPGLGGGQAGGGLAGAAGGGRIRGPGTGTSDSIPVRLSRGEYVVRAKVVNDPAVLDFLERLNREGRPALKLPSPESFDRGGLVGQVLTTALIQKLLGAFSLPTLSGGAVGLAQGGLILGAAGGGLIRGPGSTTSDSIPIRVSPGEFVVRAQAVSDPGVLAYLKRLNRDGLPTLRSVGHAGFAEGGLVNGNGEPAPAAPGGTANLQIGLDEELLLKNLERSPEFPRVLIRVADRHRKKLNNALGRGIE